MSDPLIDVDVESIGNAETIEKIENIPISLESPLDQSHTSKSPTPISIPESVTQDIDPKKRLRSDHWSHFDRQLVNEKWRAICKYCSRSLGGETKNGTSHLKDHLERCVAKKSRSIQQTFINLSQKSEDKSVVLENWTFSQERLRRTIVDAVILHEYPLTIVEHEGFRNILEAANPAAKSLSRNTTKADVLQMYEQEKRNLATLLSRNKSRIALTSDMWTASNQKKGYMTLTAHWIDEAWKLQTRLIRFANVPTPHTADALCDVLDESLTSWDIKHKVSTITLDNCSTNDALVDNLKERFTFKDLVMGGRLFHMRCAAHILNLIVRDGLSVVTDSIERVRSSVSYWTHSPSRVEKFYASAQTLDVSTQKKLMLDCKTRWNSTYLMLSVAIKYRDVFDKLGRQHPQYKCVPTNDDWNIATEICERLEIFYDVTCQLSGSHYPTANQFFPQVCQIKLRIQQWLDSDVNEIRDMALQMSSKFDKYWRVVSDVMAIGTILDPRYKTALLDYFYPQFYGDLAKNYMVEMVETFKGLVREYSSYDNKGKRKATHSASTDSSAKSNNPTTWANGYKEYVKFSLNVDVDKSDYERYMEETLVPLDENESFDILGWWKINGSKFPSLQKIARDFLCVPISTVASESAFSTGGRLISPHRNKLHPTTVEALMCCQDWLWMKRSGKHRTFVRPITVNDDMEDHDEESRLIDDCGDLRSCNSIL